MIFQCSGPSWLWVTQHPLGRYRIGLVDLNCLPAEGDGAAGEPTEGGNGERLGHDERHRERAVQRVGEGQILKKMTNINESRLKSRKMGEIIEIEFAIIIYILTFVQTVFQLTIIAIEVASHSGRNPNLQFNVTFNYQSFYRFNWRADGFILLFMRQILLMWWVTLLCLHSPLSVLGVRDGADCEQVAEDADGAVQNEPRGRGHSKGDLICGDL